jgi:hypothetical protein
MLTPGRLFLLINELINVLLGCLLAWMGLSGHFFFDPRSYGWIALSAVVILWGLRTLVRPGQWWARWQNLTRGLSLALVGVIMITIARAPFAWAGRLLAIAGLLLVIRGIVSTILVFRPR